MDIRSHKGWESGAHVDVNVMLTFLLTLPQSSLFLFFVSVNICILCWIQ